jgi:type IV pilus biogenesis protein CpaD/CtpE
MKKLATIWSNNDKERYMSAPPPGVFLIAVGCLALAAGCAPKVKVEAPDKPIEINMNVKIEHEIRVKVEKDIDQLLQEQKGLF